MWVNHHGRTLFPLPNAAKTTITHESNWSYNDDIDTECDYDEEEEEMSQVEYARRGTKGVEDL